MPTTNITPFCLQRHKHKEDWHQYPRDRILKAKYTLSVLDRTQQWSHVVCSASTKLIDQLLLSAVRGSSISSSFTKQLLLPLWTCYPRSLQSGFVGFEVNKRPRITKKPVGNLSKSIQIQMDWRCFVPQ